MEIAGVLFSPRDTRNRHRGAANLMLKRYGEKALEQAPWVPMNLRGRMITTALRFGAASPMQLGSS